MIDPTSLHDGQVFKVKGERGTFVFRGFDSDGSIRCFGGAMGHGSWRNFAPDRVSKIIKIKNRSEENA